MKYIIINLLTRIALYGFNKKTLRFSSAEIAREVANQFFESQSDYLIAIIYD